MYAILLLLLLHDYYSGVSMCVYRGCFYPVTSSFVFYFFKTKIHNTLIIIIINFFKFVGAGKKAPIPTKTAFFKRCRDTYKCYAAPVFVVPVPLLLHYNCVRSVCPCRYGV